MKRSATSAFLTLLFLSLGISAFGADEGQTPTDKATKPIIVAEEALIDLGVVPKGEPIKVDFKIRNEGKSDLIIHEARPSCGCTVAEFDKVIAPGKVGNIHAELDTTSLHGPNRKTITLYTNDTVTPTLTLTVQSDVRPYISVLPGYARFNTVQQEVEGTVSQTLWAEDGNEFEITGVKSPAPFLETSFREAKQDERNAEVKGRQWRVDVTLTNEAPIGPLSHYVEIQTNHPKQKLVKLPVSGFVRPIVAVTPPEANFRRIELKQEPLKTNLVVKNFATELIKITGVESSVEQITAEVVPVEEGRRYQLQLEMSPDMPKGDFQGLLKIKTDSPKQPVVEVPLKGTVI